MNKKTIFIILILTCIILFSIGYYQHKKNKTIQESFQKQQLEYQQQLQQWESEKKSAEQKRLDLIAQQRKQTFDANSPNHALSRDQHITMLKEQNAKFCDAYQSYLVDVFDKKLKNESMPLPDLTQATNEIETQFLENALEELKTNYNIMPREHFENIGQESFIKDKLIQCQALYDQILKQDNFFKK